MPRLQMMHQIPHEHAFLDEDVRLEKQRDERIAQDLFSTFRSKNDFSSSRDREKRTAALNDWELSKNWQNPDATQRRYSSAITRRRTDSEEKDCNIFMENIFPMKAVCHKRAFNLNNHQASDDYFSQKDQTRLDYPLHWTSQDKQTRNRRDGKKCLSKLNNSDTESHQSSRTKDQSFDKSTSGNKMLYENQYRLPENQIKIQTKEIHRKEILLQEKLLKAEEVVRKMQVRTKSGDKTRSENWNKSMDKAENRLYCTEKGRWDWESTIERAVGGRREERERERVRDWGKGNRDDTERWEKQEMLTDDCYRERRKEGTERESRRRDTQRTTDYETQKNQWDTYEETTKQKLERVEKNKPRRDRPVEWGRNEMREWDMRDWQREKVTGGERTSQKAKSTKDAESQEEWNIMDTFKSNSHVKVKASSKHEKRNELISDQWPPQENLHLHSQRVEDDTTGSVRKGLYKEPHTETALQSPPLNQKSTRTRQVELSRDRSSDVQAQLVPCKICHRCFLKERLERHIQVCEKQQQSKRKTFDSAQYRAKGTDLEKFMKTSNRSKTPELKNNWRQKHEALIHNLRQARAPVLGSFQPQPSLDVNPDYVSCPHCGRRFAPRPAERHIPKCQYIKSRPPPPPKQRH